MLADFTYYNNPPFEMEMDRLGVIHFHFNRIVEESMSAWSNLHAEQYLSDEDNLLIMVMIPKGEIMPYAHMTKTMKQWLAKGNPMMPTRHAYVTQSYIPALLIQSLLRTIPGVDLKAAFFDSEEEALAWLLREQKELNSVARTTQLYKMG